MSEHWEFYPCQTGGGLAYIFYDHGIREEINALEADQLFKIQIHLKDPNESGLPKEEEFDALTAIENHVESFMSANKGYPVGKVTVSGMRVFYSYINISEEEALAYVQKLVSDSGYDTRYSVIEDKKKEGYWNDLFPTDRDWRIILDSKMIQALLAQGDDIQRPRRIDHAIRFSSMEQLQEFSHWAQNEDYEIDDYSETEDPKQKYNLTFHHTGSPQLSDISQYTIQLHEKAKEMGAAYDGWATKKSSIA